MKIGFLGRIEARKGIAEVAKALHGLLPSFPDWVLEVAGRNTRSCISGRDYREEMERTLGPALDQVRFLESLPPNAVATWLDGVDIFVFPSLWDNFPYVILEAMACGKPIVATRTGAVPEMLSETAMLVSPGDVKALAGALRKLMADAELRSKLGAAARMRFEERFHPDRVMGEILEVYREAVLRAEARKTNAEKLK
jgi:glycosyltransferase involved in cell wall biosynthesis